MKKWLIMTIALQASFAMASYTNFIPAGAGAILEPNNWPTFPDLPYGSVTGVLTEANTSSWTVTGGEGALYDIAVRQEGGSINFGLSTALRGGSSGSGITTVYEIDDPDYEIVSSVYFEDAPRKLTLWSHYDEKMELSIIRGNVEVDSLDLFAATWTAVMGPILGTLNMGDGILHAGRMGSYSLEGPAKGWVAVKVNMLSGRSGDIIYDVVDLNEDRFFRGHHVNFEAGNSGSITLGAMRHWSAGTNYTTAGIWEQMVATSNIFLNGVINTNPMQYSVTYDGWAGTLQLRTTVDISTYDLFLGQNDDALDGVGYLAEKTNYESGTLPDGTSSTGLVLQANNVWADVLQDLAVHLAGGTVHSAADFAMRGGSDGSGITTLFEINALDYTSVTNLDVGSLTLWSQHGEDMELSIFRGTVEVATNLNLVSGGHGTINMGSGLLHAPVWSGSDANVNMLDGGDGEIVVDDMNGIGADDLYVNFESGNKGSFTFGAYSNGVSAGGTWEWMVNNGHVSLDGVPTTSVVAFQITTDGDSSTISLPGPLGKLESYLVWAGGFGLTDTNTTAAMTADPDGDGVPNLSEYGMLGDPTNKNDRGTTPTSVIVNLGGDNYFVQVHYERTDSFKKGLSYYAERSSGHNLIVAPAWTNEGISYYGTESGSIAGFNGITNYVPMAGLDQQFLRLRVGFEE